MLATTETESFSVTQLFAGNSDVRTTDVTVVAGQNLAAGTVVGRITASGKIMKSVIGAVDGSAVPIGIMVNAVDATAADKAGSIYVGGDFNVDALVWDAGYNTDLLKLKAFDGTDITVRNLTFSVG